MNSSEEVAINIESLDTAVIKDVVTHFPCCEPTLCLFTP